MKRNNISIIIQREYLNRVKKKTFLIITILVPLLFMALIFAPAALQNVGKEHKNIAFVDQGNIYTSAFQNTEQETYTSVETLEQAREELKEGKYEIVIYIPQSSDSLQFPRSGILYYSESEPGFKVKNTIEGNLKVELRNKLLQRIPNLPSSTFAEINNANVSLSAQNVETGESSFTEVKTIISYIFGFLIYMIVFMFGSMVMSGVIEEKSNRIVEIMISSVKPFQLMMGKIVGIALVGLTQIVIWIVLTFGLMLVASYFFLGSGTMAFQGMEGMGNMSMMGANVSPEMFQNIQEIINSINFTQLIIFFSLYFVGGYLLYASMFAAVGAAVDNQEDAQQFLWPITIPLIVALVASVNILQEPNGPIAFWFSMIPFTSPISMMLRVSFGVPTWQIVTSLSILVLTFVAMTYLASKIYRVGILMYGKKVSYKELWKWLKY